MKTVWVLMKDNVNESESASEHLIGLFKNREDVIKEMRDQAEYEGVELSEVQEASSFMYATLEDGPDTVMTMEAELKEIN